MYRFCESMASGGMADVYLGVHEPSSGLRRPCVLKVIRNDLLSSPGLRAMFLDEVKILLNLQHSSIAGFIDFFDEKGTPVLVLEYVHGTSLSDVISKLSKQGVLLPPVLAMHVMLRVAEALAYIHSFRDPMSREQIPIIHRDICPSNILLSFNGEVKLIDFGVAKYSSKTEQTQLGTIKGKPLYMSPEQKRDSDVTHKSDIFSFGIVFCEIVRGARFQNESSHSDQDDIQINLSEIRRTSHSDIADLVATCLELNPANRPTSSHVVRILSRYITDYGGAFGSTQLGSFLKTRMSKELEFATLRLSRILNSALDLKPTQSAQNGKPLVSKQGHTGFSRSLSEIIEGSAPKSDQFERSQVPTPSVNLDLYNNSSPQLMSAWSGPAGSSTLQNAVGERLNPSLPAIQQSAQPRLTQRPRDFQSYRKAQRRPKSLNLSTILFVMILSLILLFLLLRSGSVKNFLKAMLF